MGNCKRRKRKRKWKWKWKLETEFETGNGIRNWKWSQIFMLQPLVSLACIKYSEVASSSGPSNISMCIEKLGGPENEASTQLTSY